MGALHLLHPLDQCVVAFNILFIVVVAIIEQETTHWLFLIFLLTGEWITPLGSFKNNSRQQLSRGGAKTHIPGELLSRIILNDPREFLKKTK